MQRYRCTLAVFLIATIVLSACSFIAGPAAPDSAHGIPATPNGNAAIAPATAPAADTAVGPTAASDSGTVTITFGTSESDRAKYESLIADFEQANPDIHVQLAPLDPLFRHGDPPDRERAVLSAADTTDFPMSPEAIAKSWVRDLTPLLEADASFDRSDFYPGALAAGSHGRGIYLIPLTLRVPVLFYSKDLWAARGLPEPKPDWTWADLLAAAEQLAQKRGDDVTVYGFLDWFATAALHGAFVSAGLPATFRLDDPKAVAAVERVAGLIKSGGVLSTYDEHAPHDGDHPDEHHVAELIRNQQIGLWAPDLCCYDLESKLPSFAVGVVPFPKPPFANFTSVDAASMSSGTQHPEAAWRWLAFLSRQAYIAPYPSYNEVTAVPARKSVAERTGFWQKLQPEYAAALKAVLDRPDAPQLIGSMPPQVFFEVDFDRILRSVVSGQQSAQVALRDAQQAREQLALQSSPTPNTQPLVVATPLPEASVAASRIIFGATGSNDEPLRRLAAAFDQQHPDIFVQITQRDVSRLPPSLVERAAQSDCFATFSPPAADQITATLDLQPLADADPDFHLDDYYPLLLAPFQHDGQLYGLPHEVYLRMLMYNQSAFDAARISHPTAAWTLDDLLRGAQQLTRGAGEAKQYGFAAPFSSWREVFFVLDRFGASATRGGGATLAPNFNDPKVQQAVRWYLDLLRNYSPHTRLTDYARDTAQPNNAGELIDAGRVGMWFSFGVDTRDVRGWTLAVASPPGLRTITPNDFSMSGLYISAQTQQRAACWEWLKELSRDRSTLQGAFPARRSVADNDSTAAALPTGTTEVYQAYRAVLDRLASASAAPPDRSAMDYYWFIRAMDRALAGKNLERELAAAQSLTEQYLACVRGGATAGVCATQVDPDYQGFARP